MASATKQTIKHNILAAAMVAGLVALSGCGKSEPSAAGDAAAPPPAAAQAQADVVVELQPETAVAATGVLASVDPSLPIEDIAADPAKGPYCNLETIAGVNTTEPKIEVRAGSSMAVVGWMFSKPTHSVPVNRYVRILSADGASAWETIVGTRHERPDILPWFGVGDWALNSGFEQEVALGDLAPGVYNLVMTYTENGKVYGCNNGRTITIVQ